jgi:Family of unknown function (DUF6941)
LATTLQTLLFADHAQVRGKLLYVLSGGFDTFYRPRLPAPLNVWLAGGLMVEAAEANDVHELRFKIVGEGSTILEEALAVQHHPDGTQPPGYCPLINFAFFLPVTVAHYGLYDLTAHVDGREDERLSFRVVHPPAGAGAGARQAS